MPEQKKTVLVIDDEGKILEAVASFLESRGFRVFTATKGNNALEIFSRENISIIVLDLMLTDISGEEICKIIRKKSRIPIIILTAKTGEKDLLSCFEIGADDYITKPFSLKELHARIDTVLRRAGSDLVPLTLRNSFCGGDLTVDFENNVIKKRSVQVSLTPSELRLLSAFIKYPGKVFTRTELIDIAMNTNFEGYDRTIDNHIKNLRQKIESNPKKPIYILTIHGLGYKFGGE